MTKQLLRALGVSVTLALGGALLAAAPASAGVESCLDIDDNTVPTVGEVQVIPGAVQLATGLSQTVTVRVHAWDNFALEDCDWDGQRNDLYASGLWDVDVDVDLITAPTAIWTGDSANAVLTSGTIYDGWWEATLFFTTDDSWGTYSVDVDAWDNGLNRSLRPDLATFSVLQAPAPAPPPPPVVPLPPAPTAVKKITTYLTVNAGPEPVRAGKSLTVRAKFRTANSAAVKNTRITYWFRATGKTKWIFRGATNTNTSGATSRAFTARKSGTWQVRYAGSSRFLADKAIDTVKVRR